MPALAIASVIQEFCQVEDELSHCQRRHRRLELQKAKVQLMAGMTTKRRNQASPQGVQEGLKKSE